MEKKNLAVAWNWEYDKDFIDAIEHECERRGLSCMKIGEAELVRSYQAIANGELSFTLLFDRASDSDDAFLPLLQSSEQRQCRLINHYKSAERCRDKATMHLELMAEGLNVPHSLILPPFYAQNFLFLRDKELASLGFPFVIKPANTTGGGFGVHLNAQSVMDIHLARQEYPSDKYLLQENIFPTMLDERRAWFRVLYAFGEVIPCWWDDKTHIYAEVTEEEESLHELSTLRNYVHAIQKICKLDFFSSEIALTSDRRFVVVDYVNEVCDMRLQTTCVDGVPEPIVNRIVSLLVNEVEIAIQKTYVTD